MIDLEREEVPIECPECEFVLPATLRQVRIRNIVICRGCKRNVQLEDHLNEVRVGLRGIQQSFKELEETMENLDMELSIEF